MWIAEVVGVAGLVSARREIDDLTFQWSAGLVRFLHMSRQF